ncbi:MAG: hypothetical protein IJU44_05305 [Kiritimatiellae bacterium]|nr:hypothetical protein [Kiritimatiellia bacterium]
MLSKKKLFGLVAAWCAQTVFANPTAVAPIHHTRDLIIAEAVLEPGGEQNDATAIQKAIDAVFKSGGGTVFLKAGAYRIESPVTVRQGVTLRGDYNSEALDKSTLLQITHNNQDPEAATFYVERGGGLCGLAFFYPDQKLDRPGPYPWTIRTAAMPANDNQTVADCTLVNSWRGICIGPESNELHTFRNLRICALKTGFAVDSTTDIGRVNNVTVSPKVWSESRLPNAPKIQDLTQYMMANDTIGADYGRSDWEFIHALNISGFRTGIRFRAGKQGTSNAVMANCKITECGTALFVDTLNQVGLAVYDSTLSGNNAGHSTVRFSNKFDSIVQFNRCTFGGSQLSFPGSGIASFQYCASSIPISAEGNGQLLMQHSSAPLVKIGRDVQRVRILGYDAKKMKIENLAKNCDAMCSEKIPDFSAVPDPPVRHSATTVFARPKSDTLLNVRDFGASPNLDDNGPAFQKALDAAGKSANGATLYVPGGYYHFRANLTVPSGVELRGCSGTPHHTVSGGSVLLVHHGANDENGTPFLQLEQGSGLRGLCFWYPEQAANDPVPYPWTVRALGPRCWLVDVNIANSWQAADFGTFTNDGHRISYLSGAMFRRGLLVGNSRDGVVEDVMFNPHYALRIPQDLPRRMNRNIRGDAGAWVIDFQRQHLEGIVFRNCQNEKVFGTFLYAAHDGLSYYGDTSVEHLIHGTDTGSRCVVVETTPKSKVRLALGQLVPLGKWAEGAIVLSPKDQGDSVFYASQFWVNFPTAIQRGSGKLRLEQFNSLSGPVLTDNGLTELQNGSFELPLKMHLAVNGQGRMTQAGCSFESGNLVMDGANEQMTSFGASCSLRDPFSSEAKLLVWNFENQEKSDFPVAKYGGITRIENWKCFTDADNGQRMLRLEATPKNPREHAYVYCEIDRPTMVLTRNSRLTYRMKPLNETSRNCGLDLAFEDGTVLREQRLGAHPVQKRGKVNEWATISIPLGQLAGKKVISLMLAFDANPCSGEPVAVLVDDITLGCDDTAGSANLVPQTTVSGKSVKVKFPDDYSGDIHFTTNGRKPVLSDPKVNGGEAVLTAPFPLEFRYSPEDGKGGISKYDFGILINP